MMVDISFGQQSVSMGSLSRLECHLNYSDIDRCWSLSRLRRPQDVSRMPDEDRGQLRIP